MTLYKIEPIGSHYLEVYFKKDIDSLNGVELKTGIQRMRHKKL